MIPRIDEVLRGYIHRASSLRDLREWLALEQWDLPEAERELVDEVDGGLVDLSSGYIDEAELREHVSFLLRQYTTQSVEVRLHDERPVSQLIPVLRNTASANNTASVVVALVVA